MIELLDVDEDKLLVIIEVEVMTCPDVSYSPGCLPCDAKWRGYNPSLTLSLISTVSVLLGFLVQNVFTAQVQVGWHNLFIQARQ